MEWLDKAGESSLRVFSPTPRVILDAMTTTPHVETITSIKDPRVVDARSLGSSTTRRETGKCLLYGEQQICWALESGVTVDCVFFNANDDPPGMAGVSTFLAVSQGLMKKITGTSYVISPIGVARLPVADRYSLSADFVLVLDDVRDRGNLGTIIRTACAFGVRDVVIGGQASDLFHRHTIDASRGKIFDVRIFHHQSGVEAVRWLQSAGYQVIATSPHAPGLQSLTTLKPQPMALVVGNETGGISPEIESEADFLVRIPMAGPVESLNVGVATGISVYELRLKLVLTMLTDYIRKTLGREINVTAKLIQLAFDRRLQEVTDLNSTQAILLMIMACDESMDREQIEKDTATHGAALESLLALLLDGGLIRLDEHQGDYQLTESGKTTLSHLWPILEATEDEILDGFSEAECELFRGFVERIQRNCLSIINPSESDKSRSN
jgi:TrmH family RNA methyltransferase